MQLSYSTSKIEDVLIFTIENEVLNHTVSSQLKETILMEFTGECENIILDLSNVKEMDSSGLGALLFGKRQAHNCGGDLYLVGVAPSIMNMMQIAQLSRSFAFFDTLEEALESLS